MVGVLEEWVMPPPRKYLPLVQFLAAVPPEQQAIVLTFDDLEQLIGSLAASAAVRSYWSHSRMAWLNSKALGFAAELDRSRRAVIFTRRAPINS